MFSSEELPTRRVGAVVGDGIVDLTGAGLPASMTDLIVLGAPGLAEASQQIAAASPIPSDVVRLHAPVPHPPKNVMCVGRNYREHAAEFSASGFDASEKQVIPEHPIIFTKAPSSIIGPDEPIVSSNDPTGSVDYEGELGVVIGAGGMGITREQAFDHVYGYTIINDVTSRYLQKRHVQFFIGKTVDTFCPMGPTLVTSDEIPDITASWLRTHVNGELRQEAQVSDLIFDIPTLIETLSEAMTLLPGDVIATGTAYGTGMAFDPPRFLVPGDVVEVSIDGLGVLRNEVV